MRRLGVFSTATVALLAASSCGPGEIGAPHGQTGPVRLDPQSFSAATFRDSPRRLPDLGALPYLGHPTAPAADAGTPVRPIWVTAYYAGWQEGRLPVAEIDFGALTVLAHFAWVPNSSGVLDTSALGTTTAQTQRVVAAAHAAQRQVVITVGGASSGPGFHAALQASRRPAFVQAILSGVRSGGYDGVDVDIEPLDDADTALYTAFIQELREGLDAIRSGMLLTAAVGPNLAPLSAVLGAFDQVNLMTYDFSGAYPGWVTWHNSALHNMGLQFPGSSRFLPSCDDSVAGAVAAGATTGKLGIGIDFYGYVWSGATAPEQPISGVTVTPNVPYWEIMDTLYSDAARRWHAGVEAPYLSIGSGSTGRFVSYDDEQSIAAKVRWARAHGLGGVIVWELAGAHRTNQPAGERDLLLQALKAAAFP
jgi:chitinase